MILLHELGRALHVATATRPNVCISFLESTPLCLIVIHAGTFYLERYDFVRDRLMMIASDRNM